MGMYRVCLFHVNIIPWNKIIGIIFLEIFLKSVWLSIEIPRIVLPKFLEITKIVFRIIFF